MPRVIYYYQTFVGLDKLLSHLHDIDVIILASIHFGLTNKIPYIHLNDHSPDDSQFNMVWEQAEQVSSVGIDIILLIGGAGGGFINLFENYSTYYNLLKQLINNKKFIKGVELDVEEMVDLKDIKMLIRDLINDFGENFIITMAPIANAMKYDKPGIGYFIYKDLYNSDEGKYISWFNVQCYGEFSVETYDNIIQNGYPQQKIGMGMISCDFSKNNFQEAIETVKIVSNKYPDMVGVDNWEYLDSPPDKNDPSEWAKEMKKIFTKKE
jgi:chitinase